MTRNLFNNSSPAERSGAFSSEPLPRLRLAYADDLEVGIIVHLIHRWDRGDIAEPAMSASSGPKDYTRNHIFSIFDHYEWVAAVLMVRGEYSQIGADKHPSPPFLLLLNAEGLAYDMAGKEVEMREAAQ